MNPIKQAAENPRLRRLGQCDHHDLTLATKSVQIRKTLITKTIVKRLEMTTQFKFDNVT
jgi:hypothetical protein